MGREVIGWKIKTTDSFELSPRQKGRWVTHLPFPAEGRDLITMLVWTQVSGCYQFKKWYSTLEGPLFCFRNIMQHRAAALSLQCCITNGQDKECNMFIRHQPALPIIPWTTSMIGPIRQLDKHQHFVCAHKTKKLSTLEWEMGRLALLFTFTIQTNDYWFLRWEEICQFRFNELHNWEKKTMLNLPTCFFHKAIALETVRDTTSQYTEICW